MSGYHFGESGVVTKNKFIQGVQRKFGKVEMRSKVMAATYDVLDIQYGWGGCASRIRMTTNILISHCFLHYAFV